VGVGFSGLMPFQAGSRLGLETLITLDALLRIETPLACTALARERRALWRSPSQRLRIHGRIVRQCHVACGHVTRDGAILFVSAATHSQPSLPSLAPASHQLHSQPAHYASLHSARAARARKLHGPGRMGKTRKKGVARPGAGPPSPRL